MSGGWGAGNVPAQHGRVAVVTGANSGIGFEAARVLAGRGAAVVLACRDPARGREAATRIGAAAQDVDVHVVRLDLASLASVREAAGEIAARHGRLDLLINNAGVMMTPRGATADGFELQFGTNHLGHFALTGLLLDRLLAAEGSRVVTVSSLAHRQGRIDVGDLHSARRYRRMAAYGQSKLANLMFTYELQRRLAAAGSTTGALAAHPGIARTALMRHMPRWVAAASTIMPAQDAAGGSLPVLRAATDPGAAGGEYYGPGGWQSLAGPPRLATSSPRSHDEQMQRRLWEESERMTGVVYPL